MKVKACPQCGKNYLEYCFHYDISDGMKVASVEMGVEEAVALIKDYISDLEYDLERANDDLQTYLRKIDGD